MAAFPDMNILLLNYEYPPLGGGAGKATAALMAEFETAFPDTMIDILASSASHDAVESLSKRITLYRLDIQKRGLLSYQSMRNLVLYLREARKKALELMKIRSYDLVHAFFALPTGLLPRFFLPQLPYIISLRGSDVPGYSDRFRSLNPFLRPLFQTVCSQAAAVTANSKGLKNLALKSAPNIDISVIPNGVSLPTIIAQPGTRRKPLRLLFVGRLIPRKGIPALLKGLALANQNQPLWHLDIAGSGPDQSALQTLTHSLGINGSVAFHDQLDKAPLDALYADADLFILPSLNEGMSNALLEALSFGLPVAATDTGGSAELVNGNGRLIEKDSPQAIQQVLNDFGTHPERLADLGKESRRIASLFSWKNTAKGYYQLYQKTVLSSRKGNS
ncbi:MAG: hypothetical protein A2293_12175 [Elusimicrobia bacterium RIFOXYB2_FULL_49_7]|nr:MAG: hypothetical protein A2293_12175 [Elusimicrobia bacterium RIFOXYB2_FULL_49_7]